MRLTYFDDAGMFNSAQEPYVVIGGIIVHADNQLVALEEEIDRLVRKHIPEDDWYGFVFHAMEIWSGIKYFKSNKGWTFEKRMEILSDLVEIPKKIETPICFGYQSREKYWAVIDPEKLSYNDRELVLFSDAYLRFCEKVEYFMKKVAPDEITLLIGEDNNAIHKIAKHIQSVFRDPKKLEEIGADMSIFPFRKIRESVQFATKQESKSLQMADICTFVIKRRLMNDPRITEFYDALVPWMTVLPKPELLAAKQS